MRPLDVPAVHTPAPHWRRDVKRVLIVDDDDAFRAFTERVLKYAGYDTLKACSGLEAIDTASSVGRLDLLLTDFAMPQMTGDELGRRLRRTDSDLKILYLTGFSDDLFRRKMTLWDREGYLDKPCSIRGLLEAVSLLLCGSTTPVETTPFAL